MPETPAEFDESLLRALLNSANIGILAVDTEGIILESNNRANELLSEIDPRGKLIAEYFTQSSQLRFLEFFKKFRLSINKGMQHSINLEVYSEKKEVLPLNLKISEVAQLNHIFVVVLTDISIRKELEEEVEKQKHKYEFAEVELQKEQELNELKSRFVSMASHEFRTPLAGILSSINLIKRYLESELEEGIKLTHFSKIDNHIIKVKEAITNLTTILNEFLSIGKLEEGKISYIPENVDLKASVEKIINGLKLLKKKNQKFVVELNNIQSQYVLDKNMFRNILNNLLTNAIKYSPEGGKIELTLKEEDNLLIIQVKDDGIGIPSEDQKNLFSQFFRAKNVTNIQGTGLGLVIVKKYAEIMKGDITFESELNKGSIFTVKIPVSHEI